MQKDAELHAEDDKKKRELVEAKNNAETFIYSTEKTMKELGDKVPAELQAEVITALASVTAVKDGTDAKAINDAVNAAMAVAQKVGSHMYQKNQENPTQDPAQEATTEPTPEEPKQ